MCDVPSPSDVELFELLQSICILAVKFGIRSLLREHMPHWAVLTVCLVMMSVADHYCDFRFAHLRHTFCFYRHTMCVYVDVIIPCPKLFMVLQETP